MGHDVVIVVEYHDVHANDINHWLALDVKIAHFGLFHRCWTAAKGRGACQIRERFDKLVRRLHRPVHPTIKSRRCEVEVMTFGRFR